MNKTFITQQYSQQSSTENFASQKRKAIVGYTIKSEASSFPSCRIILNKINRINME